MKIAAKKMAKFANDVTNRVSWMMSSYDKYHIVCLSGTGSVHTIELKRDGNLIKSSMVTKAPGRVLNFIDDQHFYLGTLMLVDSS